jgi:hypothetical protein
MNFSTEQKEQVTSIVNDFGDYFAQNHITNRMHSVLSRSKSSSPTSRRCVPNTIRSKPARSPPPHARHRARSKHSSYKRGNSWAAIRRQLKRAHLVTEKIPLGHLRSLSLRENTISSRSDLRRHLGTIVCSCVS